MSKKSENKQYIVLGLGVFGSTVAKTLSNYNTEVIAIDKDVECVQRLADTVTQAVRGDFTNIEFLRSAGAADCDCGIVAVGSHLEESIMAVLNLKELGVDYVICKAKNRQYKQILEKIGANKVVRPEKQTGVVVAKGLLNKRVIDMVDLDNEYSVVEIQTPNQWINKTLAELDVRNKYNVNILGIRYATGKLDVTPAPDYKLQGNDHVVVISDIEHITKINDLD